MKDALNHAAALIAIVTVVSVQIALEEYRRNEKTRLFAYLDVLVRTVDWLNAHSPLDRDTTRASNEAIPSLLRSPSYRHVRRSSLLRQLHAFLGNAPLVHGRDAPSSLLDPTGKYRIATFNLVGEWRIPTRIWISGSGYGSAFSSARQFVLFIPARDAESVIYSTEPVLFEQNRSDGAVSYLSLPESVRQILLYGQERPTHMRTYVDDERWHEPLRRAGRWLVTQRLSPVIEMISYERIRSEILRLASLETGKLYTPDELQAAVKEALNQQRTKSALFGLTFGQDLVALVLPLAYLLGSYLFLYSIRRVDRVKDEARWWVIFPDGRLERIASLLVVAFLALSAVPVCAATMLTSSRLTSTGLPGATNWLAVIGLTTINIMAFTLLLRAIFLAMGLLADTKITPPDTTAGA